MRIDRLEMSFEYYEGEITIDGKSYTFVKDGGRWFVYDENTSLAPHNGFIARTDSNAIIRVLQIITEQA